MKSAISWFEIPATDLDRAQLFYETIFQCKMNALDMPGIRMRMFPIEDMNQGVGGALCDSGGYHQPSASHGVLIYLNANPDVAIILNRVVAAGGTIVVPKTAISPEYGYMGVFLDTEGNRIALHSV